MNEEILYRIAVDKNGGKLGKIIRIEHLPGKTVKKDVPYAIIHVIKALRREVKIPIELSKRLKVEEEFIWFDINKSDFDDEVRKQRAIQKHLKSLRKSTFKKFAWFMAK
ncbi:MAG: hypothetical protein KAS22_04310 [Candidatus Heimdallarchaeota archaeon]|nr:hypothetical protein [Candidatus Heimdallarchaeota archaeon]